MILFDFTMSGQVVYATIYANSKVVQSLFKNLNSNEEAVENIGAHLRTDRASWRIKSQIFRTINYGCPVKL
jgi:hypothetical protein